MNSPVEFLVRENPKLMPARLARQPSCSSGTRHGGSRPIVKLPELLQREMKLRNGRHDGKGKKNARTALSLNLPISASAASCARTARAVQIHGHWRIEAPRNRFGRRFRLKLGRKAARGVGLGGSAAAIYSHS